MSESTNEPINQFAQRQGEPMVDGVTNAADQPVEQTETVVTPLSHWNELIEELLCDERPLDALPAMRVVLKHLPQHLSTYQRLVRVAWMTKRWDEGYEWGARLLRADPGHALAWRAIAMAIEQRGHRPQARAVWQRAFESHPYEPDIRAGVQRTGLNEAEPLMLNHAGLAALQLRCQRWRRAAQLYAALVEANPPRTDFRINWMVTLWQGGDARAAYRIARQLVEQERLLFAPWVVLNALGDHTDKALALNPIQTMDPDGEYIHARFGIDPGRGPIQITVTPSEAELLDRLVHGSGS